MPTRPRDRPLLASDWSSWVIISSILLLIVGLVFLIYFVDWS